MQMIKWITAAFLVFYSSVGLAEEVANYADCDACHGAIRLNIDETKEIFGTKGIGQFSNMPERGTVKLDLDGVLKPGGQKTDDSGFEIKAWIKGLNLYIKDLKDGSLMQFTGINTSFISMYLEASKKDEIHLQDPVPIAWAKMRKSGIYQWVSTNIDNKQWAKDLPARIIPVLSLLKQQRK